MPTQDAQFALLPRPRYHMRELAQHTR